MNKPPALETPVGFDIGIDFGTSKCAMYWAAHGDELDLLPVILEGNSEILRSAVYVQDADSGGRSFLVGERAFETLLARGQSDRYFTGFKLVLGEKHPTPHYELHQITPAALAAAVIHRLLEIAAGPDGTLGKGGRIVRGTISHPAGWDIARRTTLREAAEAAHLEDIHFIEEPIAALYHARRIERSVDWDGKRVMVVDYGGGTCDVAICQLPGRPSSDGRPELLTTKTLAHGVGGEEVTFRLAKFLRDKIAARWPDLVGNSVSQDFYRSLLRDAENAKYQYGEWYYSGRKKGEPPIQVHIRPPRGFEGLAPAEVSISEADFSGIAKDIVKNIRAPIGLALSELGIDQRKIDLVYMAGGSSRMPLARQLVEEMFGEEKIVRSSNPRKEVAYGAAYSEWFERKKKQRSYKGVRNPKALLIAHQKRFPWYTRGNKLTGEIELQTLIKAGAKADDFRTPKVYHLVIPEEGCDKIQIPIYEQQGDDNTTLAPYNATTLSFDRPLPKGTRINVWYALDYDGRLILRAEAIANDRTYETPRIIGPLTVNQEHVEQIRSMVGIRDSQESTLNGN